MRRAVVKSFSMKIFFSAGGLLFFRQNCTEDREQFICSNGYGTTGEVLCTSRKCPEMEDVVSVFQEHSGSHRGQGDLEKGPVNADSSTGLCECVG